MALGKEGVKFLLANGCGGEFFAPDALIDFIEGRNSGDFYGLLIEIIDAFNGAVGKKLYRA